MEWVDKNKLARGARPGYPLKERISVDDVDTWVENTKKMGIN